MKLPDWLLLLWLACVSVPALPAPIDISSPRLNHAVAPALEVREDPGGLLALPDILATTSAFHPATRLYFPRCACAVWTRFTITNPTAHAHQILVVNPWPHFNLVDLHAIRADGRVDTHLLGDFRRDVAGRITHRYDIQPLRVEAGETVEVITRYVSAHALNVGAMLYSENEFMLFLQRDAQVWGIFNGLIFALLIYTGFIGFSLRLKPFLVYGLHAALLYVFTISLMGESVIAWLMPAFSVFGDGMPSLSALLAGHISRMLTAGIMITATWFASTYFDLRTTLPRGARLATAWISIVTLLMAAEFLSAFFPVFEVSATLLLYILPFFLFGWLGFALFAVWRKIPGSRLYVAGTGSFVLLSLLQDAHWLGLDIRVPFILEAYGVPLGFMLELVFLGLALGGKVRRMKEEHDRSEELLLEQARFSSVGQRVSGVVHQLKRPVIYAGTQLMKLEALADRPLDEWREVLPKQLLEMRKTIDFMDRTIVDLYHFYSTDTNRRIFSPAEQIEQALRIITPMTTGSALRIEKTLLPEAKISGHAHAFAHALLIVLENAAQVLEDRQITAPCIGLVMVQEGATLKINIMDNAGGIHTNPPDRILRTNYSRHAKLGMGIGLVIARRIIEEKLQGRISVRNHKDGALFSIELPLATPLANQPPVSLYDVSTQKSATAPPRY